MTQLEVSLISALAMFANGVLLYLLTRAFKRSARAHELAENARRLLAMKADAILYALERVNPDAHDHFMERFDQLKTEHLIKTERIES